MIPMGELEKVRIKAFEEVGNGNTSTSVGEYEFQVNPSSYSESFTVEYNEDRAVGANGTPLKYNGQLPDEWEFEILIDGTGVVKKPKALDISLIGNTDALDVEKEVKKLKSLTVDLHGNIHRNYYLIVAWGQREVFKGNLVSLNINYKLFKPDGTPLRAIATIKLKACVSEEERGRANSMESPDITHLRSFTDSDRLDLMVHKIYGSPNYYIDVAKVNQLNSFRKIKTGEKISLPPII